MADSKLCFVDSFTLFVFCNVALKLTIIEKATMGNTSTSSAVSPEAVKVNTEVKPVTGEKTSYKALPSECPMHQNNVTKQAPTPSECPMHQSNIDSKDALDPTNMVSYISAMSCVD